MRTNPPPPHQPDQPRSSRSSSPAAGEPAEPTEEWAKGYVVARRQFRKAREAFHAARVEYSQEQDRFIAAQVELITDLGLVTDEEPQPDRADLGTMFDVDDPSSFTVNSEGRVLSTGRAIQQGDFAIATDQESRLARDLQADGETEGEESR